MWYFWLCIHHNRVQVSISIRTFANENRRRAECQAKIYLFFQIIYYLPENISYLWKAQLERRSGVATPALFVRGLVCTLLVTTFCPHSPKLRRSTALGMIKIASMEPWYLPLAPALRNSYFHPIGSQGCFFLNIWNWKLLWKGLPMAFSESNNEEAYCLLKHLMNSLPLAFNAKSVILRFFWMLIWISQ